MTVYIDIPCLCMFIFCLKPSHVKGVGPNASSKFHWLVQSTWRRAEESATAFLKASPLAAEASWKCRSDCESTPGYLSMVTQCRSKMNWIEQILGTFLDLKKASQQFKQISFFIGMHRIISYALTFRTIRIATRRQYNDKSITTWQRNRPQILLGRAYTDQLRGSV